MPMLEHALALADKGLHVFPCAVQGKIPATKNGCLDATCDPDTIKAWWRSAPSLNIAVATGKRSGVFVLDFDKPRARSTLERERGALPATVTSITPKGQHLWFQYPAGAEVRNSASKLGAGVDVRGEHGYVVAPPSVHPCGRRYYWSHDAARGFAEAPAWLIECITSSKAPASALATVTEWRDLIVEGAGQGKRDCTITRLAGYLISRSVDPFVALELLNCWNEARCRPPLAGADIERIVNSICGRELRKRAAS